MTKVKEIIAALNILSDKNSFEVYLPLLKRNVKFRPLTTKQQKYFYECLKDNVVFNTKFIIATFNIIKENCVELDLVDKITVIDRLFILLAYRKNTLGNTFQIEKDGVIYNANLDDCLKQAEEITLPQNKLVAVKNVQVELHVPVVVDQYGLEKELRETLEIETFEVNQLVGTVVVNEICKAIKEIWLIENDTATPVGFNGLKYADRIDIIENLPAEVMFDLQEFVGDINVIANKVLTVVTESGEVGFDITADFFLDE